MSSPLPSLQVQRLHDELPIGSLKCTTPLSAICIIQLQHWGRQRKTLLAIVRARLVTNTVVIPRCYNVEIKTATYKQKVPFLWFWVANSLAVAGLFQRAWYFQLLGKQCKERDQQQVSNSIFPLPLPLVLLVFHNNCERTRYSKCLTCQIVATALR